MGSGRGAPGGFGGGYSGRGAPGGGFMGFPAPNGMSWGDYCMSSPVGIDGDGFPAGAWGECVAHAKMFELENPGWDNDPEFQDDGPVGQVITAMKRVNPGIAGRAEQAGIRLEEEVEMQFQNGGPIPFIN